MHFYYTSMKKSTKFKIQKIGSLLNTDCFNQLTAKIRINKTHKDFAFFTAQWGDNAFSSLFILDVAT
jgi:hypothetical protein